MDNPIQTQYDNRIARIQARLQKRKGKPSRALHGRLNRLETKQYIAQQRKAPPAPIPEDPAAQTIQANAQRQYDFTTGGLTQEKLNTEQQYGVSAGYNDFLANPYSQAAMLAQSYQRNQANTFNNYAGSGQLYAGSLGNAQSYDRGQYGAANNSMLTAYQQALTDIAQRRGQAGVDLADAKQTAAATAIQDALNNPVTPDQAPPVPANVRKVLRQRIKKAQKHHNVGAARRARRTLRGLVNPNPLK